MADIESLNAKRANVLGMDMTPLESLMDAERSIRTGEIKPTGSIIILLDDNGHHFHWQRLVAGMKTMEAVALLESVKHALLSGD